VIIELYEAKPSWLRCTQTRNRRPTA
jgi:hypothetical protein